MDCLLDFRFFFNDTEKTFPFSFSLQGRGLGASPLNDSSRTRDSFLVDSGLLVFLFENSFDI